MTFNGILQIAFYLVALIALGIPLGAYMARVYKRERTFLDPLLGPVEKFIYRLSGVKAEQEMDWKQNAVAMLLFNAAGFKLPHVSFYLKEDSLPQVRFYS